MWWERILPYVSNAGSILPTLPELGMELKVCLSCQYWSQGSVSGVRKKLLVWASLGALQQNIVLILSGLSNYCLSWKLCKVLAWLRQDNLRVWDSWRHPPVVGAAEEADVSFLNVKSTVFCSCPFLIDCFRPLFLPFSQSLYLSFTHTCHSLFTMFFCLSIWHKPSRENPAKQTIN